MKNTYSKKERQNGAYHINKNLMWYAPFDIGSLVMSCEACCCEQ